MGTQSVRSARMTIRTAPDIREAMKITAGLCLQLAIPEAEEKLITLAVEEACTNTWKHGTAFERAFTIRWVWDEQRIHFEVRQKGNPFKLPSAPAYNLESGGRGLLLIQKIADSVWVEEDGEDVVLHMRILIQKEGTAHAERNE